MKACWRNTLDSTSKDRDKNDIACGFIDRLIKDAAFADQSAWNFDKMAHYNARLQDNEERYRFGESGDFLTSFITSSMTSTSEIYRRPSASLIEEVFERIDGGSSLQLEVSVQARTATATTKWPPSDGRTVWSDGASRLPLSAHTISSTDMAVGDRCDSIGSDASRSLLQQSTTMMMQSQFIG